jgi:hypothetical protein
VFPSPTGAGRDHRSTSKGIERAVKRAKLVVGVRLGSRSSPISPSRSPLQRTKAGRSRSDCGPESVTRTGASFGRTTSDAPSSALFASVPTIDRSTRLSEVSVDAPSLAATCRRESSPMSGSGR